MPIFYRQHTPDAEPVLDAGQELPGPCPRCGRPPDIIKIVEILVTTREEAMRALAMQRLADDELPLPLA
jgi:hypothetical protein